MWFADWFAREKMVSVRGGISAILVGFESEALWWRGRGKDEIAGRWFD